MTTATTGRIVDAPTERALRMAYKSLVKAGNDSVRAAWRFGQTIDSFSDSYRQPELADAMGLSVSTLHRYRRLYLAYQRPELALKASEELQTFNIDVIYELQNQLHPVRHGRPMAGRRFRYRCNHCSHTEITREEFDPETGEAIELADLRPLSVRPRVCGPGICHARGRALRHCS